MIRLSICTLFYLLPFLKIVDAQLRGRPAVEQAVNDVQEGVQQAVNGIREEVEKQRQCPLEGVEAVPRFNFNQLLGKSWYAVKKAPSVITFPGTEPYCLRRVYQLARLQAPPPIPATVAFPFLFENYYVGQKYFDVTTSSNMGSVLGDTEEFKLKAITTDRQRSAELTEGPSFVPNSGLYVDSFIVAGGTIAELEIIGSNLSDLVVPDRARDLEWFILSDGLPRINNGNGCIPLNEGYSFWTTELDASEQAMARMVDVANFLGYDTSPLKDVEQDGCSYPPIPERDFTLPPI